MLGKTFKGMTDEVLAWQTRRLQEIAITRDDYTVYVRPQLVVEIAFDGVQTSPHYGCFERSVAASGRTLALVRPRRSESGGPDRARPATPGGNPLYPEGLALRFARLKRYRDDKSAQEADTIDTVRAIHAAQVRPAD